MISIISFLLSPLGRIVAAGLGIVVFVSAFAFDQRSRGAASAVAKIERQTNEAVSKAHSVRDASASRRGMRDPFTLDENVSP